MPRIGATYALGKDNKTLLRASYSQYADQLGANAISFVNAGALAGLYYYWNDANGDHVITRDELDLNTLSRTTASIRPTPARRSRPTSWTRTSRPGRRTRSSRGIEREILHGLRRRLAYTYRKYDGAL